VKRERESFHSYPFILEFDPRYGRCTETREDREDRENREGREDREDREDREKT
jgi:hypothetical protein